MILLTGNNVFEESKRLLEKVNFDLDLAKSNPLIYKSDTAPYETIEHNTHINFDKVYQEILLNGKLQTVIDERTNKAVYNFRGIVVLRDGHVCAILDEEVHFLYPLYFNRENGNVYLQRDRVASNVPFENVGIPAEDYNERARRLLNPIEQATKQIIAIVVFNK